MRNFARPAPLVKPNRRTSHPADPFGAGILESDWEELARQAEWEDTFNASIPLFGRCCLCGEPNGDLDPHTGLCDRCSDRAIDITTAGQNGRAGLGYQVF